MGKRSGGFIWSAVDLVMFILTLVAAAAMVCAYIAPSADPNKIWLFAYAGLAAPVIYLSNLFLMLYWAIRWKIAFFLPVVILLIGLPKVKMFYHFPGNKQYEEADLSKGIKVMTYNVEGFLQYDSESKRHVPTARQITDYIKTVDPDIVCLQEFQSTHSMPESTVNEWLSDWPYRKLAYTISREGRGVWGSAIYSKYPIVSSETIEFEETSNGALWVEVLVSRGDTLRVICNHLETTYIKDSNLNFLQPENFANDPDRAGQIRQIAGRLRKGFRKRAHQADTIATIIASRDIPTVVCGDFNDPPMSYSYHTIRNGYGDTFEDKGRGYGYTYKRIFQLMRIDYILRSPHLETLAYESPDIEWSDHRPVIAILRILPE